jgi:glycosyl transferase family 25
MIQSVVINLKRHHDRLSWFMENALKVNLTVERIDAVDVHDQSVQTQIDEFMQIESALSRAEAACFLSHRKAWERLLDSQEPYIAVFEDDVHLSKDISNLLSPELVPEGIGLIKLEYPLHRVAYVHKAYAKIMGRKLHRLLTNAYGAAGYIVSRECAKRLLELSATFREPVDVFLFDQESPLWQEFSVLQVVPAACIQDHALSQLNKASILFKSAIEAERKDMGVKREAMKLKRKRLFSNIKMPRYISCILKGANPFRYRDYVTLDLGSHSVEKHW